MAGNVLRITLHRWLQTAFQLSRPALSRCRVVAERLKLETDLHLAVEAAVVQDVEMTPTVNDLLTIKVDPPIPPEGRPKLDPG